MTFNFSDSIRRIVSSSVRQSGFTPLILISALMMLIAAPRQATGQGPASSDVLVLSNGDMLHGKLVNSSDGKITFHSEALGDVAVSWDTVKELRTSGNYAILEKGVKTRNKRNAAAIPEGNWK
jgi:hypothetical protein